MKRATTVAVVVAVSLVLAAGAMAAVTSYVSNPHSNSVDWANAVTAAGVTITSLDLNGLPTTTTL